MKIPQPYRCDYCPKVKGEANHWWLRSFSPLDSDLFTLFSWDDASAAEDGVEHICSEQCAVKALSKWLASIPQRDIVKVVKARMEQASASIQEHVMRHMTDEDWEKAEGK